MSRFKESLAIFISIIMTNVVLSLMLKHNLDKGIYSPDGDSIAIPEVGGLVSSAILLLIMLPSILIPQTRRPLVWIQIALLVLGGCFAGLNGIGWVLPNHYFIALSYLIVVIVAIWLVGRRIRKIRDFLKIKSVSL